MSDDHGGGDDDAPLRVLGCARCGGLYVPEDVGDGGLCPRCGDPLHVGRVVSVDLSCDPSDDG